jgi:SAM-dependent methyltransferase
MLSLLYKIDVLQEHSVLDIGAGGFGGEYTTKYIIQRYNHKKITLMDVEQFFMPKIAKYTDCNKVCADFFQYDFGNEKFDLITVDLCTKVQFGRWQEIWEKIGEILNTNGYVIFNGIMNINFIHLLNARHSTENESLIRTHLKETYGTDILTESHYKEYFAKQGYEFIAIEKRTELLNWVLVKKIKDVKQKSNFKNNKQNEKEQKAIKNKKPILTVAIPAFNSAKIAWLAMEGLCNQKKINFDWEIVIAEETSNPQYNSFGFENFMSYKKRLEKIGCKRIDYRPLEKRITLTEKWKLLGQLASENSIGFVLQACDCYSYPTRLLMTFDAMKKGFDWCQCIQGYFYEIKSGKIILYKGNTISWARNHLNMAFKTEYAKKIPFAQLPAGIDGWLFKVFEGIKGTPLLVYNDSSNDWQYGLDTHGANNISKNRGQFFNEVKPPFVKAEGITIEKILPKNIVEKLKNL